MANQLPNHLYVHVPFCAHRCGYCDFVTVPHQPKLHARYVDAVFSELALRAADTGDGSDHRFDTVFVGGGTPTLLEPVELARLLTNLNDRLIGGGELSVECNPETVTPQLAGLHVEHGVSRVSLGAQSFSPHVLETLERRATPDTVRGAADMLRAAGVRELSLDLIWAVPGQTDADVRRDLAGALALAPGHLSAYELEFKPGTRLTHKYAGRDLDAAEEAGDEHYEIVIDTLEAAGYEWYETANFARNGHYAHHNIGYWTQADYAGVGIGAVGTVRGERRMNLPNLPRYLKALEAGELPPARLEEIDADTAQRERIMLALRLARPCTLSTHDLDTVIDHQWLDQIVGSDLATVTPHGCGVHEFGGGALTIGLTRRGRLLLSGVLSRLLK
ncbi:MAG: radical SAM family heme chaperone HemW [Thermoleophilia bacterium]|nr:radical SAM family heme chaperone HemW [Thermoleophilia bacterium]